MRLAERIKKLLRRPRDTCTGPKYLSDTPKTFYQWGMWYITGETWSTVPDFYREKGVFNRYWGPIAPEDRIPFVNFIVVYGLEGALDLLPYLFEGKLIASLLNTDMVRSVLHIADHPDALAAFRYLENALSFTHVPEYCREQMDAAHKAARLLRESIAIHDDSHLTTMPFGRYHACSAVLGIVAGEGISNPVYACAAAIEEWADHTQWETRGNPDGFDAKDQWEEEWTNKWIEASKRGYGRGS